MGSARQEDVFCRKLSNLLGITIAAVDYRLAPEHPFPTPLEDCYTALSWVSRQEWADSSRLAIGGASAGGGLAAALAQLVRDRGEIRLALQMLVHPMLDDRTGAVPTPGRRIMWSDSDNQIAWRWYLGDADPAVAVPARRTDLTGLPPAWMGVGTLDMFYGECLDYAARLRAAGVSCHQEIAVGAFHTFDLLIPNAPISLEFFASQCRHLRAALRRPIPSVPSHSEPLRPMG
jgi:acetyl esterase/lipase